MLIALAFARRGQDLAGFVLVAWEFLPATLQDVQLDCPVGTSLLLTKNHHLHRGWSWPVAKKLDQ